MLEPIIGAFKIYSINLEHGSNETWRIDTAIRCHLGQSLVRRHFQDVGSVEKHDLEVLRGTLCCTRTRLEAPRFGVLEILPKDGGDIEVPWDYFGACVVTHPQFRKLDAIYLDH